jgi:hypothetical protein
MRSLCPSWTSAKRLPRRFKLDKDSVMGALDSRLLNAVFDFSAFE